MTKSPPTTPHPSMGRILGIFVGWPLAYLAFWGGTVVLWLISGGVHGELAAPLLWAFMAVFVIAKPMVVLTVALLISCLWLLSRVSSGGERVAWALALVVGNVVAMPVFYWRFIRVAGQGGAGRGVGAIA